MMSVTFPINEIDDSDRIRGDVGDVRALAASIQEVGLLHPIVVLPWGKLVAGGRRLAALRSLGFDEVPCTVVHNLTSAAALLKAERDENTCREPLAHSEMLAVARRLGEIEAPAAKERQGTRTDIQHSADSAECYGRETRDIIADAVGIGRDKLGKIEHIIDAAADETAPDEVREVAQDMKRRIDLPKGDPDRVSVNAADKAVTATEDGDITPDELATIITESGAGHVSRGIAEAIESRNIPVKPDLGGGISHPARYTDSLIPVFDDLLKPQSRVLDPFAGTGKIHALRDFGHDTTGVELEPEWAVLSEWTAVGNALALPYNDATFDAIVTSPTYGNRLADHHNASDPETRRSYTHDLGRSLSEDNSGAMQWGDDYREFHHAAWKEALRVLNSNGRFILNIKDHIRGGEWQDVVGWHVAELCGLGMTPTAVRPVATPSMRAGANGALRVDAEMVIRFETTTLEDAS